MFLLLSQSHLLFLIPSQVPKASFSGEWCARVSFPFASRPIKAMDQLVRLLVPVDIDSAVLHLLSAGKEEPGTDKLTQSAVTVSNDADVLPLWEVKKKLSISIN